MVAGADGLRCDARKRLPDAAGRAFQPPYSRLCQSARHSCDRLFGRAAQARPCGRIYLAKTTVTQGLFLVLVGRAQAPVWEVGAKHHIERKKPMPYVNHYSFQILDPDWGHLTIKISGHPPFPAQVILNGHEYVACQARKAGIAFTKEGNCFTTISDAAGLAKIAETLSEHRAV